eukprot:Hpha_TRINITY_DN14727_c0_g2::TRINITY_DN14727_c0_g2_i1::g.102451::m.102451/K12400/AP4E1; AP-4 complex subunit epsilon-1
MDDRQSWVGALAGLVTTAVSVPVGFAVNKASAVYAAAPGTEDIKGVYNSFDGKRAVARVSDAVPEMRERARAIAEEGADRLELYMQQRASGGFASFLQRVLVSETDEEQAAVAEDEARALEAELAAGGAPGRRREQLVRAVLCEMLGQPTSFAHRHAIQLCGGARTVADKRFGYMATALLLPPSSEMRVLVCNLLASDIQKGSWVVAASALTALRSLVCIETLPLFEGPVVDALQSREEEVRVRGVLCLQTFYQLLRTRPDSSEGRERLLGVVRERLLEMVHDPEPAVCSAALHFVLVLAGDEPEEVARHFLRHIWRLHRAIVDRRLGEPFRYQGHVAPFAQLTILRIYAAVASHLSAAPKTAPPQSAPIELLHEDDPLKPTFCVSYSSAADAIDPSTEIVSLVEATLRQFQRAGTQTVLEGGILFEVVRCVARLLQGEAVEDSEGLETLARRCVLKLLKHEGANHRLMGMRGLRELLSTARRHELGDEEREALGAGLGSVDKTQATVARQCLCSAMGWAREADLILHRLARDLEVIVDPEEGSLAAASVLDALASSPSTVSPSTASGFLRALFTSLSSFVEVSPSAILPRARRVLEAFLPEGTDAGRCAAWMVPLLPLLDDSSSTECAVVLGVECWVQLSLSSEAAMSEGLRRLRAGAGKCGAGASWVGTLKGMTAPETGVVCCVCSPRPAGPPPRMTTRPPARHGPQVGVT